MQKVGESEYGQVDSQYDMIFMLGGLWPPFLLLKKTSKPALSYRNLTEMNPIKVLSFMVLVRTFYYIENIDTNRYNNNNNASFDVSLAIQII